MRNTEVLLLLGREPFNLWLGEREPWVVGCSVLESLPHRAGRGRKAVVLVQIPHTLASGAGRRKACVKIIPHSKM